MPLAPSTPHARSLPFPGAPLSASIEEPPASLTMLRVLPALITAEQIEERVGALAAEIAPQYRGRPLTIVGVLTGSLMFLADLVRRLDLPLRIGFIQVSSYRGAVTDPGTISIGPEVGINVRGRDVLLLDDILDTGQTLRYLVEHLTELGAASVRVAVLLRKEGRQRHPIHADYVGFNIPDAFVVGYGLDFNDEYRHLPYVAVLPQEMYQARD
jgi:hypoxanthine phosphoribosyltransferase